MWMSSQLSYPKASPFKVSHFLVASRSISEPPRRFLLVINTRVPEAHALKVSEMWESHLQPIWLFSAYFLSDLICSQGFQIAFMPAIPKDVAPGPTSLPLSRFQVQSLWASPPMNLKLA